VSEKTAIKLKEFQILVPKEVQINILDFPFKVTTTNSTPHAKLHTFNVEVHSSFVLNNEEGV